MLKVHTLNRGSYLKLGIPLIVILLMTSSFNIPHVHASTETKISIAPRKITGLSVDDTFTVNVTVSDVSNLFGWDVAIEYDVKVVNLTAVWLPKGNVFEGKNPIPGLLTFYNFTTYGFIVYGANLLLDTVSVPDVGLLCSLNFTVIGVGQTNLRITTLNNPAIPPGAWMMPDGTWFPYGFWTYLQDFDMREMPFIEESCAIATIGRGVPPVAIFNISPTVLEHENLLLIGNTTYFVNEPIIFNASRSYDPDGNIVNYIWDFGDGNITVVSTPIIYHIYHITYRLVKIKLMVVDNDGAIDTELFRNAYGSEPSDPNWNPIADSNDDGRIDVKDISLICLSMCQASQSITIGLTLEPVDYTPVIASFFGLIVLWIVYMIAKSAYKYVKRRKLLKGVHGTVYP